MTHLLTIKSKGEGYTSDVFELPDGSVKFVGDADIDIDGSPDWRRDPCGQCDTTLQMPKGGPVNGQEFPFVVMPPEIIKAVKGIVLGCKATVRFSGSITDAVVADVGPHNKLGEMSPACARALGINDDPNIGGVDNAVVEYQIWPGVPARLPNKHGEIVEFDLQPYGKR